MKSIKVKQKYLRDMFALLEEKGIALNESDISNIYQAGKKPQSIMLPGKLKTLKEYRKIFSPYTCDDYEVKCDESTISLLYDGELCSIIQPEDIDPYNFLRTVTEKIIDLYCSTFIGAPDSSKLLRTITTNTVLLGSAFIPRAQLHDFSNDIFALPKNKAGANTMSDLIECMEVTEAQPLTAIHIDSTFFPRPSSFRPSSLAKDTIRLLLKYSDKRIEFCRALEEAIDDENYDIDLIEPEKAIGIIRGFCQDGVNYSQQFTQIQEDLQL